MASLLLVAMPFVTSSDALARFFMLVWFAVFWGDGLLMFVGVFGVTESEMVFVDTLRVEVLRPHRNCDPSILLWFSLMSSYVFIDCTPWGQGSP